MSENPFRHVENTAPLSLPSANFQGPVLSLTARVKPLKISAFQHFKAQDFQRRKDYNMIIRLMPFIILGNGFLFAGCLVYAGLAYLGVVPPVR